VVGYGLDKLWSVWASAFLSQFIRESGASNGEHQEPVRSTLMATEFLLPVGGRAAHDADDLVLPCKFIFVFAAAMVD